MLILIVAVTTIARIIIYYRVWYISCALPDHFDLHGLDLLNIDWRCLGFPNMSVPRFALLRVSRHSSKGKLLIGSLWQFQFEEILRKFNCL